MTEIALIDIGGKQYEVSPQSVIEVEKLPLAEGEAFETDKVLLVRRGGETLIGTPYVPGARVVGRVLKQKKAKKVVIFKYKPKKNYRRKRGQRQWKTEVLVEQIQVSG